MSGKTLDGLTRLALISIHAQPMADTSGASALAHGFLHFEAHLLDAAALLVYLLEAHLDFIHQQPGAGSSILIARG